VFRITKNNHNILQGVNTELELTTEQVGTLDEWCEQNAARYWTGRNCPLAHRSEGGAHIVVIDDPQMPKLVDIAKQNDPDRPVIFRSHIQVRGDRANDPETNTAGVWNRIWGHVQHCDLFVSHPVPDFVPRNVTPHKVGYMPATTDWLDGLNKHLDDWDNLHYLHEFRMDIRNHQGESKFEFEFPRRRYIVQIARFDPAKGIPDVLASYACLRKEHMKDWDEVDIPQLVIAGHGAIDDPDAKPVYKETMDAIKSLYSEFEKDIIVMRVGPTDQILNVLMQNAYVALQLSTREGFEVKVSEALHAGVPIIATRRGGIPLQVVHERDGFLVHRDIKDEKTGHFVARDRQDFAREVAQHLKVLFTNADQYDFFAEYARTHVSDEVSTVGNALCWLYLADTLAKGKSVVPERKWIHDMAREQAKNEGVVFDSTPEEKLPRTDTLQPSQ
jgi:glycosyltransferase involved in cell wall biosynthesis